MSNITTLNVKLKLRRDNDYNYRKIENELVPLNGEVCLIDVPGYGLRAKVGDGESTFAQLPYADEAILSKVDNLIVKGYYYKEEFYADTDHEVLLDKVSGRIYIDTGSSSLYIYDGISYAKLSSSLPNASADIAGIMKLYDQKGQNTDGTMTQRAITEELDEKFEVLVDDESEMVVFDRDLF